MLANLKILINKSIIISYAFYDLKSFSIKAKNSFTPLISYSNAYLIKQQILDENREKSGIYRWVNNLNGKSYVGSAVNLSI